MQPEAAQAAAAECASIVRFDRGNFSHPTRIDNTFLPLVAGTRMVLEGTTTLDDGTKVPHRVVFIVTDLTKVINGVTTRVVLDRDFTDDALAEAELAFFAQDDAGNVWALGEYPEEFEDGQFVGAPNTWIPGQRGAKAGVLMLARPRVGTPRYIEGSAPNIDFLDCGQVFATGQSDCVPFGCSDNVLVVDENSPLEPDSGHQRKFYAAGVGNTRITAVEDPEGETLTLTRRVQQDAGARAETRDRAFKLERRAYRVSEVYQHTPPMRRG